MRSMEPRKSIVRPAGSGSGSTISLRNQTSAGYVGTPSSAKPPGIVTVFQAESSSSGDAHLPLSPMSYSSYQCMTKLPYSGAPVAASLLDLRQRNIEILQRPQSFGAGPGLGRRAAHIVHNQADRHVRLLLHLARKVVPNRGDPVGTSPA